MAIDEILHIMVDNKASDLYLKCGKSPTLRVHGQLVEIDVPPISPEAMQGFCSHLMTDYQRKIFESDPDLDIAYAGVNECRFRVNIFRQRGNIAMVIRLVRTGDLTFEQLHLPPVVRELVEMPRGLVLVTGATGSGKSTTLAAMVEHVNSNFSKHIVTIEDPIEFLHDDKLSTINQREIGYDTNSFLDALHHVVRQSPDVIMIGEMRDLESITIALSAALIGHLVLSTLHTTDVTQTVDRMINYFPEHMRAQVWMELSMCLEGIISMRLIRRKDGQGRIPALEIMRATPRIRKLLSEGRTRALIDAIKTGGDFGMKTFNQSLVELYNQDLITYDDALFNASSPEEFKLNVQGMYTGVDSIGLERIG